MHGGFIPSDFPTGPEANGNGVTVANAWGGKHEGVRMFGSRDGTYVYRSD